MTDAAKPTKGPWKRDLLDKRCVITEALVSGDIVCLSPEEGGFEESSKHWEANATLIIEAGTVYHETGLTPRQLAEQRSDLCEMLRVMCDKFEGRMGDYENAEFHDEYNAARAIIAKVEAKP